MRLLETFDNPAVPDRYRFVFDETNPDGLNTVLAMSEGGKQSAWAHEQYDPDGLNAHLGKRVLLGSLGNTTLNAFFYRLSVPQGTEDYYATIDGLTDDIEAGDGYSGENQDDGDPLQETHDLLDRLDELRLQQLEAERKGEA